MSDVAQPPQPRLIRQAEVSRLTGLDVPLLYYKMQHGTFPRPIKISARAVAWRETDIAEWQKDPLAYRSGVVGPMSRPQAVEKVA